MNSNNRPIGVAILGTRARGGIRAVIENHIESGVYDGMHHFELHTHVEGSALRRGLIGIGAVFRFLWLLLRHRIDICHIHGSMKGSIYRKSLFVLLCKLFGRRVIFHLHGSEFEDYYRKAGPFYRRVVRYVLNHSDSVFVLSRYWFDFVCSISSNRNVVIINNFPSSRFETTPSTRRYDGEHNLNYLFLGYLGKRKGIYDLIEAVASIRDQLPRGFRIHVGGNGEEEQVRAKIAALEVGEFFEILGWVSGEQKASLLAKCNVLLLPSYNEGMPIAILEAFASGLAVVSTRVGGIPDLITNEAVGFLTDAGDTAELARIIASLVERQELIEGTARRANEVYQREYSATVNVSRIRNIYHGLAMA